VLSPREKEVWAMLAFGLCHKEISAAWKRSTKTVEWHRRNLFAFFGFPSFAFMVRLAKDFGLVDYK
jgi:DNA-binding CsgD family transcriptional regulator